MRNRKQITKICDNCSNCGLPIITCICNKIKNVKTKAKFIILSHEHELDRNTNTASLLKLINSSSTEIVIWERGKVPKFMLDYSYRDKYRAFLVFPSINEEIKKRSVEYTPLNYIPVFIIIDGTWKEAWKIIKKSEYLKELPVISLVTDKVSKFTLRRGQEKGNLCTIETTIELLKLNEEISNANEIDYNFNLFLDSYRAGSSGHEIKK